MNLEYCKMRLIGVKLTMIPLNSRSLERIKFVGKSDIKPNFRMKYDCKSLISDGMQSKVKFFFELQHKASFFSRRIVCKQQYFV